MRWRRRGANAIEFALTLPLFIWVSFAVLEYGWLFFRWSSIHEATRLGCEQGAMVHPNANPTPTSVARTSVRSRLMAVGYTFFDVREPQAVAGAPPEGVYAAASSAAAGGGVRLICNGRIRHKSLTRALPAALLPAEIKVHVEMRLQQQP